MEREEFLLRYWRYYINLERDFIKTIRFVEIHNNNFNTFSIEYAKQYQSICSEIDVLSKSICSYLDKSYKASNIKEYGEIILKKYPDITSTRIRVQLSNNIVINPFKDWCVGKRSVAPLWWKDYNKVKHNRIENFNKANLRNVINALGALFLLEIYFLRDICEAAETIDVPDKPSELFIAQNFKVKFIDIMCGPISETII